VALDSKGNIVLAVAFTCEVDFGGTVLVASAGYDIAVAKLSPSGEHIWSKAFTGPNNQYITSVVVDGSDNIYLAGDFFGSIDFGEGPMTSTGAADIFVAKLDGSGEHLWSQRAGGPLTESLWGLALDVDGHVLLAGDVASWLDFAKTQTVYSAGGSDAFVAKLSDDGEVSWVKAFGDATNQRMFAVAVDASSAIVLTGRFGGTIDFGGGPWTAAADTDLFVAKLDAQGEHAWSTRYGGPGHQTGHAVALNSADEIYLVGYFDGSLNFGGGNLPYGGAPTLSLRS